MIRFLGRWMADCLQLTCMLAGALLFMQIPALTHAYAVALLQVAQDARRDIDQREADARQYYHLPPNTADEAVVAALRLVEPSNAETLQQSLSRAAMFYATQARIAGAPLFSEPLAAAWDAVAHPEANKLDVLRTSFVTYIPQVTLDASAIVYGVVGLLLGGLLGHSLSAITGALTAPRTGNRRPV